MDTPSPSPDAELARLQQELEKVTNELKALPLINDNKKLRLALNQRKLDAEAALQVLLQARARAAKEAELAVISERLRTLGDTPQDRLQRSELKRAMAALKLELAE